MLMNVAYHFVCFTLRDNNNNNNNNNNNLFSIQTTHSYICNYA